MAVGDDEAVEQLINTASALGSSTIDLSKKKLTQIPTDLFDLQHLEFLYLEGNNLSSIPEDLFNWLPNLRWLDLRNNRLSEVPPIIGKHRNLRNLLLEGNNIGSLPLELGLVKSLSGLNLAGNPLVFPPSHIVEKGTQEVLKFLREQCLMQLQNSGDLLREEPAESSSSEELVLGTAGDSEMTWPRMQDEQVENETNARTERFKLPPIIQAAARPRNRPSEDTEGLLRGQRAKQFEPEKPSRALVHLGVDREQKPSVKTVKQDVRSPRKDVLFNGAELKDNKIQLEPLGRSQRKSERVEVATDSSLELTTDLYIVDNNKGQGSRAKVERPKRKRRTRVESPQKNLSSVEVPTSFDNNKLDDLGSTRKEGTSVRDDDFSSQLQVKTSSLRDVTPVKPDEPRYHEILGTNKTAARLGYNEGDMVAIQVPEKLYIKGQPCLGQITSLADHQGLLTVHYYTGSYEGRWRPMMSRTSPYLRKVPQADVLSKFKLTSDGRMSPITRRKLRTIIDDNRKSKANNDAK